MKLLSIGNSFSVDAQRWLHTLAEQNAIDLQTGNLYIGGCSLEMHCQNVRENAAAYTYYVNGEENGRPMSIAEALALETWDVVTLQQASHFSGAWDTYEPYLSELAATVRAALPKAEIRFHQTWAYEVDADHPGFEAYRHDQQVMFRGIQTASALAATKLGTPLIPCGEVIQALRTRLAAFDYPHGGRSLNRDGFHLSLDYGRFAAAATWLYALCGRTILVDGMAAYDFDVALLKEMLVVITDVVNTQ